MATDSEEIRVVDPDTGAQKGSKIERYDLIPAEPLRLLARHYGVGSRKYAERNWEGGYDWSLSYAALQRHANAFWSGEDIDEETGTPHIVAVAWHAFALAEFANSHPEKDNRPTTIARRAREGELVLVAQRCLDPYCSVCGDPECTG